MQVAAKVRQNKRFLSMALISVGLLTAAHAQNDAPQIFEAKPIVPVPDMSVPDMSVQAPVLGPLTLPPEAATEAPDDLGLNLDLDAIFDVKIEPQAKSAIDLVEELFPSQAADLAQPSRLGPPVPSTTPYAQPTYDFVPRDEETRGVPAYETPFGVMGGLDGVKPVKPLKPVQPLKAEGPELRLSALDTARPGTDEAAQAARPEAGADDVVAINEGTQEITAPELEARSPRIGKFSLLNKVTGKVRPVELLLDEPLFVDDLSIVMFDCLSTPPEDPPETKAFLRIFETRKGNEELVFSGWMFASSPGLNGLEHPEYDLWPKACVGEDGLVFTGDPQD
jgi:hypothetical protein